MADDSLQLELLLHLVLLLLNLDLDEIAPNFGLNLNRLHLIFQLLYLFLLELHDLLGLLQLLLFRLIAPCPLFGLTHYLVDLLLYHIFLQL